MRLVDDGHDGTYSGSVPHALRQGLVVLLPESWPDPGERKAHEEHALTPLRELLCCLPDRVCDSGRRERCLVLLGLHLYWHPLALDERHEVVVLAFASGLNADVHRRHSHHEKP